MTPEFTNTLPIEPKSRSLRPARILAAAAGALLLVLRHRSHGDGADPYAAGAAGRARGKRKKGRGQPAPCRRSPRPISPRSRSAARLPPSPGLSRC